VKLLRAPSIIMKPVQHEETFHERSSDADALASWGLLLAEKSSGGTSSVALAEGAFTSTIDGVVDAADAEHLWLKPHADGDPAVCVTHHLPDCVDLQPLLGVSIRATMVCEEGSGSRLDRTLILTGDRGRVWVIARSGAVHGITHPLSPSCGDAPLHAALSQRPLGPLSIGTSKLQCLISVGASAILAMPDGSRFRATHVKRRTDGTAVYVIADAALSSKRAVS